jgi:hypothetical protein
MADQLLPNLELASKMSKRIASFDDQDYPRKRPLLESAPDIELDNDVLGLGLTELQSYITRLEQRAKDLGAPSKPPQPAYTYHTLYRILHCGTRESKWKSVLSPPFFDAPEWIGSSNKGMLRCHIPVDNFELYLEKNKHLAFIIYKTYVEPDPARGSDLCRTGDVPKINIEESIKPITEDLKDSVRALLDSKDEYTDLWQSYKASNELLAPYLFVYHQRADRDKVRANVAPSSQEQFSMLWNYILEVHGDEYATADAWISSGKTTSKYIQYVFKPGDILIERKGDFYLGRIAKSWARYRDTSETTRGDATTMNTRGSHIPIYGTEDASKRMANEKLWVQNWDISAWHWEFDGNFQRTNSLLSFSFAEARAPDLAETNKLKATDRDKSEQEGIPIKDLQVFPIQHAPEEVVQQLRRRGKTFWKCRVRAFVSYEEYTRDGQENMVSIPQTISPLSKSQVLCRQGAEMLTCLTDGRTVYDRHEGLS